MQGVAGGGQDAGKQAANGGFKETAGMDGKHNFIELLNYLTTYEQTLQLNQRGDFSNELKSV